MTITLESIKADADALAAKIATFEAQAAAPAFFFPETTIDLRQGEHYAGLIIGNNGDSSYHLILLQGEAESINWKDAKAWATGQGGELPNRREQALLFANLKDQFKPECYWSSEEHASESGWAWYQYFNYGSQLSSHTYDAFRARAVRRLFIE